MFVLIYRLREFPVSAVTNRLDLLQVSLLISKRMGGGEKEEEEGKERGRRARIEALLPLSFPFPLLLPFLPLPFVY